MNLIQIVHDEKVYKSDNYTEALRQECNPTENGSPALNHLDKTTKGRGFMLQFGFRAEHENAEVSVSPIPIIYSCT